MPGPIWAAPIPLLSGAASFGAIQPRTSLQSGHLPSVSKGLLMRAASETAQPPSSGLALIIPGWVLTGLGILNLVTLPICFTEFYSEYGNRDVCAIASGIIGGLGLGIGVPLLAVGYNKKKRHKAWKIRHHGAFLDGARFAPLPGGGVATLRFAL